MEIRLDFLRYLETDAAVNILACLDDTSDLIRASLVSHCWRDFVISTGLCKHLCLRNFPQLANIAYVTEPNHEVKKSTDAGSSTSLQWEALEREHRVYGSLFRALTKIKAINCLEEAFGASSTDNYPEESINNTLDPREAIRRRYSYWSSKGQTNPSVPETLIYKLKADICVITEIGIRPFRADFQPGLPIYSAKSVRFRMGHPKSPTEISNLEWPLQQHADEKIIWTYTSPVYSMSQINVLQHFKLPEPVLCVGGFVQLELMGRVQTQEMDEKYYICVSHVEVIGRPLFPAFDVDITESSGKFILKYYPEALLRTMSTVSNPVHTDVDTREDDGAWEHLQELVGFLMQRNEDDDLIQWAGNDDDE
ncbi:hypothetical protein ACET3Z_026356 [Daucus carota]